MTALQSLTPRELDVVLMQADNETAPSTAKFLGISVSRVEKLRSSAYKKLGCSDRKDIKGLVKREVGE